MYTNRGAEDHSTTLLSFLVRAKLSTFLLVHNCTLLCDSATLHPSHPRQAYTYQQTYHDHGTSGFRLTKSALLSNILLLHHSTFQAVVFVIRLPYLTLITTLSFPPFTTFHLHSTLLYSIPLRTALYILITPSFRFPTLYILFSNHQILNILSHPCKLHLLQANLSQPCHLSLLMANLPHTCNLSARIQKHLKRPPIMTDYSEYLPQLQRHLQKILWINSG